MIATGKSDHCVLLHRRPYSDSRWLVDYLTVHHGRVSGIQRQVASHRHGLELFTEYHISWRGKSQLVTITRCDLERSFRVGGRKLYLGLYMNELIVRTTRPEEEVEGLYEAYVQSIESIGSEDSDVEPILRDFERALLRGLGYEIVFDYELAEGRRVEPELHYQFVPDGGFQRVESYVDGRIQGASLLAIASNDYDLPRTRQVAKSVLRTALQHRVGNQPIISRSLFGAQHSQNTAAPALS
ncbi:MAG: DNA repair protein RecO [Gammaproteobacteria bacterium]|nr:DNA repair protein RecO [Gammaproteobacteria bacterium]